MRGIDILKGTVAVEYRVVVNPLTPKIAYFLVLFKTQYSVIKRTEKINQ